MSRVESIIIAGRSKKKSIIFNGPSGDHCYVYKFSGPHQFHVIRRQYFIQITVQFAGHFTGDDGPASHIPLATKLIMTTHFLFAPVQMMLPNKCGMFTPTWTS
jgi:hypothetical protein